MFDVSNDGEYEAYRRVMKMRKGYYRTRRRQTLVLVLLWGAVFAVVMGGLFFFGQLFISLGWLPPQHAPLAFYLIFGGLVGAFFGYVQKRR